MAAYGFHVRRIAPDHYRLSWTVDHKYPSSRLRFPRAHSRDTDRPGAERFARKHELRLDADPQVQAAGAGG